MGISAANELQHDPILRALLEAHADAALVVDGDGRVVAHNAVFARNFANETTMLDRSIELLLDRSAPLDHPLRLASLGAVFTGGPRCDGRVVFARTLDGAALRPVEVSAGPVVTDRATLVLVTMHDATARLEVERKLHHASTHDALTGLSNRALIEEARAPIERRQEPFAVVIADVDGLKAVNDRHGHEAGDALIVAAGDAMRSAVTQSDDIVARLGGDEFALLLVDATEERLEAAMRSVREYVSRREAGSSPVLALSVGGAIRNGGESLARVMRRADEAMYRDKMARRAATSASPR